MLAAIKAPFIDWSELLPFTVLTVGGVVVLLTGLVGSQRFRRGAVPLLTLLTLVGAAVALLGNWNKPAVIVSGALRIDDLTVGLGLICLVGAFFAVILALRVDNEEGLGRGEFHTLLIFSVMGMLVLIAANDLVTLFLGIELLSIPLYVLCAGEIRRGRSLESGLKYLILGSVGSATLLYGLALLYGATGTTSLTKIGAVLTSSGAPLHDSLFVAGMALVIAGFAFKASAAPFHQWTPDVYEGAPASITTFMATATKAAALGVLLRVLAGPLLPAIGDWGPIVATISVLSILVGNFGALGQDSLKRMLAWSSVAQVGYLLAAVVVADQLGVQALVFYLVVYTFMTLAAFAVVIDNSREWEEGERMSGISGLGRRRPWLAGAMTVSMVALAGLPPTDGFTGKLNIIAALVDGNWTWLGFVVVFGSLVSLAYYLRVVAAMWMKEPSAEAPTTRSRTPEITAVALVAALLTLGLGFAPSWPLDKATEIGQKSVSSPR